jgi:hypothetical protein
MADQTFDVNPAQTTQEPNDLVRQILKQTLVTLLPVLIDRYLTDEMIEKLIQRALARLNEA